MNFVSFKDEFLYKVEEKNNIVKLFENLWRIEHFCMIMIQQQKNKNFNLRQSSVTENTPHMGLS